MATNGVRGILQVRQQRKPQYGNATRCLSLSITTRSKRDKADLVDPVFSVGGDPDQQQIFDGWSDVQVLRHDDKARARFRVPKSREVNWHRLSIMRDQNPVGLRSEAEYFGVRQADDAAVMRAQEADRRFSAAKAEYYFPVEVDIPLTQLAPTCRFVD